MPVLLRVRFLGISERRDLPRLILVIRRAAILLLLVLGYVFFRLVGEGFPLVSIGLISFCGVAQFAPSILAGLYWKDANLTGAVLGLCAGVAVVALHPGAADPGRGGPRRSLDRHRRAVRHRAAAAGGAPGSAGPRHRQPRRRLEPRRQFLCRRAVRAAGPAEQPRAPAGRAVRRGRPASRRGRAVARRGQRRGPARPAHPLSRPGARRYRLRPRPAPARPDPGTRRRRRRGAGAARRAPAGACDRVGQRSGDGGLGGARRGDRARGPDADPRRDQRRRSSTASGWSTSRRRSSRRPPSCAKPTSGCVSSTSSRTTSWRRSATSCGRH